MINEQGSITNENRNDVITSSLSFFFSFQEVSGKLLESCSNIAGSCLEATTWLRRNLTVKTDASDKREGVGGELILLFWG